MKEIEAGTFNKKPIYIIATLFLLILVFLLGQYLWNTKDYKSVDAKIVSTRTVQSNGSDNNGYYVAYEYQVNGKKYKGSRMVRNLNNTTIGDKESIKYNPNKPAEIYDSYKVHVLMFLMIFPVVILLFLKNAKIKPKNKWNPSH